MKRQDIYMRDPFVLAANGRYYLYGTTDEQAWGGPASGFKCYESHDLTEFTDLGFVFRAGGGFWGTEQFWAPEVHFYNGRYYLFASFHAAGRRRGSQILVSERPDGEFTPITEGPVTPENWECLDATLYVEDGAPYVVYCHEWVQIYDGTICFQRLSPDLTRTETPPQTLFRASEAPWVRPVEPGKYVTDGPFFYRLKSGKLLLLWSSLGEEGYAQGMAVSDNGRLAGPWRHIASPLFQKDGGHGMVFAREGSPYVSLHVPNEPHLAERPAFFAVRELEDRLILAQENT